MKMVVTIKPIRCEKYPNRTGVDENTIFFYAGAMEEDLINREDIR